MATTKAPSPATVKRVVYGVIQGYNHHDMDEAGRFFTDDVVSSDPDGTWEGKAAVLAHEKATIFELVPDVQWPMEAVQIFRGSTPGQVAVLWRLEGRYGQAADGSGPGIVLHGVTIGEIEGDLLAKYSFYYDSYGLLQQMGLLPKAHGLTYKALTSVELALGKAKDVLHV